MLKCMTPQARPSRRPPAPGFGLVELLLALGLPRPWGRRVLGLPRVTTRVKVASDVENVRDLASRVDRSHGVVGSFRGVSTLNVLEDGLAPTDFRQASAATMSNAWGGAVTVSPATVRLAGDAFTVGLSGLPARACVPFVSAIADDVNVRDVIVGNTSVLLSNRGSLDVPGLGLACGADGAVVDVVYYSGLVAGSSVAVVPTLPLLHARRPWPFNADTGWPHIHRSQRARCSAGRSWERVAKPWGCSFPGSSTASCCAQRSGASAAPNAGPHPGSAGRCRAGNRKARWLGPAARRALGARRRCARARSALPATWIQTQTPRGSIPRRGFKPRRWRP